MRKRGYREKGEKKKKKTKRKKKKRKKEKRKKKKEKRKKRKEKREERGEKEGGGGSPAKKKLFRKSAELISTPPAPTPHCHEIPYLSVLRTVPKYVR